MLINGKEGVSDRATKQIGSFLLCQLFTRWSLWDEIDGSRLCSDVFARAVDPDIRSHDFVVWLRESHVAIQHGFVGSGRVSH